MSQTHGGGKIYSLVGDYIAKHGFADGSLPMQKDACEGTISVYFQDTLGIYSDGSGENYYNYLKVSDIDVTLNTDNVNLPNDINDPVYEDSCLSIIGLGFKEGHNSCLNVSEVETSNSNALHGLYVIISPIFHVTNDMKIVFFYTRYVEPNLLNDNFNRVAYIVRGNEVIPVVGRSVMH